MAKNKKNMPVKAWNKFLKKRVHLAYVRTQKEKRELLAEYYKKLAKYEQDIKAGVQHIKFYDLF